MDLLKFFGLKRIEEPIEEPQKMVHPEAWTMFNEPYDGEKEPGDIGVIKDYYVSHYALAYRSWQAYLDSDVAQLILSKFLKWVVGSGLRLNADPDEIVLASEGITALNEDEFSNLTESRFKVYSNANFSSHSGEESLQTLAFEAYKAAIIGGDVLVVNRVENKNITTQLIDGKYIITPSDGQAEEAEKRGNRVVDGVEIDKNGKHVAYFVETEDLKYKRIKSFVNGQRFAYLVYGRRYKTNDLRGIPLIQAVLDTIAKLDRYKEATVGSAEERQKIAYSIEHDVDGQGQNPLLSQLKKVPVASVTDEGQLDIAQKYIANTMQKQAINLPAGAKLNLLESRNELYFESFMTINMRFLCATVEIPMEVALSWFDSNYSASRAALKDWEHTLSVEREKFSRQFYQNIYSNWLNVEVLLNRINAPGYVKAFNERNEMAINAYQTATFIGANIPHIDPMKEVQAERLKLGSQTIPLTTAQAATEALNGGDFKANVNQYRREIEEADGINEPPAPIEQNGPNE